MPTFANTWTTSGLNTWLLKKALSLPAPVLRGLSGGGVVYSQGRTLDPQIQFVWRSLFTPPSGRTGLSLTNRSLESARQEWQDAASLFGVPDNLRIKYEQIGADAMGSTFGGIAPISGLLIRPARISEDAPLLVFFHQGGGVLGGHDLSKAFCALLAQEARCPIFLPDYRLAPANRFPAALDDARIAFEWAQTNAFRLGARSGLVAVGGALIGANLAMRLSLNLRRDFKPMPAGQLLITPLADLSDPQIKVGAPLGLWPLTTGDLDIMISHYAGAGTNLDDPRISPALEPLINGQPKTFIVSAGLDPLAAQGETLIKRLSAARIQTLYRRYDTLPLGFDLFAAIVDDVRAATLDIAENWVDLLRSGKSDIDDEQAVA